MKHWTRDGLSNFFRTLSRRAERISQEFDMGNPDLAVCDRLLRQIWSDVGDVLRQRKQEGWPK